MREEVLYKIFLDLHKNYGTLDRGLFLEIIAAYGVGPRSIQIIWRHWDCLTMVKSIGGYFGAPFKGQRSMTQGELPPITIFNVVVDTVLWHWVTVVSAIEDTSDTSTEGFGRDIQQLVAYLYASNGLLR